MTSGEKNPYFRLDWPRYFMANTISQVLYTRHAGYDPSTCSMVTMANSSQYSCRRVQDACAYAEALPGALHRTATDGARRISQHQDNADDTTVADHGHLGEDPSSNWLSTDTMLVVGKHANSIAMPRSQIAQPRGSATGSKSGSRRS